MASPADRVLSDLILHLFVFIIFNDCSGDFYFVVLFCNKNVLIRLDCC